MRGGGSHYLAFNIPTPHYLTSYREATCPLFSTLGATDSTSLRRTIYGEASRFYCHQ